MVDTEILEDIGLTKGEIKVYLALLELGSTKVGPVIEKSGLQSSVVHNCLHKLIEKGLVSFVLVSKVKHYQATDPKSIVSFIDEKKKRFQELLPYLISKQALAQERQSATIYEGFRGMKTMFNELMKDAKKGEDYLFFLSGEATYKDPQLNKFFIDYNKKRFDLLKRAAKGLANSRHKPHIMKAYKETIKMGYVKFRFVNQEIPVGISLFRNRIGMNIISEKIVAILIESSTAADHYRKFFYDMWERAKN